jgi:ring-1,2-phenylacetyl-CoA epoxidase subunit PaaC
VSTMPSAPSGATLSQPIDPAGRDALAELLLSVADDEFVIGFWDSEWTGIAPMLEEDVATSSIAQDELGHARALYELLAGLTDDDADRIAFGREPDAYRHAALLNHGRGDWAFSVARRWLYESADAVRLEALARSSWVPLAQLATKMRREETYHRLHADAWLRRLADAAPDVNDRLSAALTRLWADAQEVFAPLAAEEELVRAGYLPEPMRAMHVAWQGAVLPVLALITGAMPKAIPSIDGRTRRTEEFAWLHGQFTMVARSEEGASW